MLGNLFCTDIFPDVSALAHSTASEMPLHVMVSLFLNTECHQVIGCANNDTLTNESQRTTLSIFNQFLPLCVGGKEKHASVGQKFYYWFKMKFISPSLMNTLFFEIILSKTQHKSTEKGKRTWVILQKMWQIKNPSTF